MAGGYEIRLLPQLFDQPKVKEWCEEHLEEGTWAISFGISGKLILEEEAAMAFKLTWMPEINKKLNDK